MNELTAEQLALYNLLDHGKKNAITKQEIVERTGYSERKVRMIFNELREQGYPIISHSSCKGYWLASNRDEAEGFAKEMECRGKNCLMIANKVRNSIKENYVQEQLCL